MLLAVAAAVVAAGAISCAQTSNGFPITPYSGATAQDPVAAISATVNPADGSLEVNFDATGSSDGDGTIVRYDWDWENDGTYDFEDGGATPAHTYSTEGTYQATVRVTDNSGATDTATSTTFTVPLPNAAPTASATATQSGDTTQADFDATGSDDSDGTIESYDWDWENDGTYDLEDGGATPSHDFGAYGNYTVKLRVTDNDGETGTAEIAVNLQDPNATTEGPTAALEADPESGAAPLPVTFDASGSTPSESIVLYEWDWDSDGDYEETTTEATIQKNLTADGTYVVTVRVTDDQGETDTASVDVIVGGTVNLTAGLSVDPVEGEAPLEVTFDATGSNGDNPIVGYAWDFDGDGLFSEAGTDEETYIDNAGPVTHTYTENGDYEAQVKIKDNHGNEATATKLIEVGPIESTITVVVTITGGDAYEKTPDTYMFLYRGNPNSGGIVIDQGNASNSTVGDGNPAIVEFLDVEAGTDYYVRVQNTCAWWDGDTEPTEEDPRMVKDFGAISVPPDNTVPVNAAQWREPPGPQGG